MAACSQLIVGVVGVGGGAGGVKVSSGDGGVGDDDAVGGASATTRVGPSKSSVVSPPHPTKAQTPIVTNNIVAAVAVARIVMGGDASQCAYREHWRGKL